MTDRRLFGQAPRSLEWLTALVWAFLMSSLVAVAATAMSDIRKEEMERFAFKVSTQMARAMRSRAYLRVGMSDDDPAGCNW